MTTEEREKALDKVRKLLRLSQSSNANEAALAAAKAQEIMDRYEIEAAMLSLDENRPDPINNEPIEDFGKKGDWLGIDGYRTARSHWAGRLGLVIAQANGCFVYRAKRIMNGQQYHCWSIIGRGSDVETVRVMFGWVSKEVDMLIAQQRGASYQWKASYAAGIVDGINDQLKLAKARVVDQMRAEATSATALVRVNTAIESVKTRQMEAHAWGKKHIGFRSSKSDWGYRDMSAREHGREVGRNMNLAGAKKRIGPGQKQIG